MTHSKMGREVSSFCVPRAVGSQVRVCPAIFYMSRIEFLPSRYSSVNGVHKKQQNKTIAVTWRCKYYNFLQFCFSSSSVPNPRIMLTFSPPPTIYEQILFVLPSTPFSECAQDPIAFSLSSLCPGPSRLWSPPSWVISMASPAI